MKYVGLQSQIWRNNSNSIILLILFPLVLFGMVWLFIYLAGMQNKEFTLDDANYTFLRTLPWVTSGVLIWFLIAYFSHSSMIMAATGSKPLERMENKRVYNLKCHFFTSLMG